MSRLSFALGLVLLVLAVLCGRMLLGARLELARASQSHGAAQGRHLRRALAFHLPLNPWSERAQQQFVQLAQQTEQRGEVRQALLLWHELRSALLRLRSFYQPFSRQLPEINRRIVVLSAQDSEASEALRSAPGQAQLGARLAASPHPHRLWTTAALLGFLLWVGGAVAFCLLGLKPDASPRRRAFPRLAVVLGGLGLFALGLALA